MSIIVCNIGWMKYYMGQTSDDAIERGGSYVDDNGVGHEVCNFLPHGGWLYGFVQSKGQINLSKLGGDRSDNHIDGVTVVWTATRPKGGTVVVGWYQNARVYRGYEPIPNPGPEWAAHGISHYNIRCRPGDATLLPVDARNVDVPRGKGGMGQSPTWYADGERGQAFRETLERVIASGKPAEARAGRAKPNVERNKLVEMAAMDAVTNHYAALGYDVKWVHNENKGWDIEARSGRTELWIEVKGLSLANQVIELTPNEYRAFLSLDPRYRLAVVSLALSNEPTMAIVSYNGRSKRWEVEGKPTSIVNTEQIVAARIEIA